uniref:Uncharacterized protein n=1 Tax=Peronospora matthiolae TaxID=2874970 RepID=A0AAV1UQV2_9STRA
MVQVELLGGYTVTRPDLVVGKAIGMLPNVCRVLVCGSPLPLIEVTDGVQTPHQRSQCDCKKSFVKRERQA